MTSRLFMLDRKLFFLTKKLKRLSKWSRCVIAALLLLGGLLWFLPILGLWMIPVGLLFLSRDFIWPRRVYTWIIIRLRKMRDRKVSK